MSDKESGWGFDWGNNWGGGWKVVESNALSKKLAKKKGGLPKSVRDEYEVWKVTIRNGGLEAIEADSSYNHKELKGGMRGLCSSRLSKKYRVIYSVDRPKQLVYVEKLDIRGKVYGGRR